SGGHRSRPGSWPRLRAAPSPGATSCGPSGASTRSPAWRFPAFRPGPSREERGGTMADPTTILEFAADRLTKAQDASARARAGLADAQTALGTAVDDKTEATDRLAPPQADHT